MSEHLTDDEVKAWVMIARRDDWHRHMVGSDLRCILADLIAARAEVERLRSLLRDGREIVDEWASGESLWMDAVDAALEADDE